MQEWTKTATELSSITTYKNFSAGCGLSHAYSKDIIRLLLLKQQSLSLRLALVRVVLPPDLQSLHCENTAQPCLARDV